MMKRISYYPGCALKSYAKGLESAAQSAMDELGVEMAEIPDWNCCGVVYSLAEDDKIRRLAPVRNLIRAWQQGGGALVTLCPMCYNTLARANLMMRESGDQRDTINRFMYEEPDYHGEIEVLHLLTVLERDVGWERISKMVKRPLTGLRIAPYYGCMLTRPRPVAIEAGRDFRLLTKLLESLGAEVVYFEAADRCCGSYQSAANPAAGLEAAATILNAARKATVDALVLACPLCEFNLVHRQNQLLASQSLNSAIPVVYFSHLMAYSFGLFHDANTFHANEGVMELLGGTGQGPKIQRPSLGQ